MTTTEYRINITPDTYTELRELDREDLAYEFEQAIEAVGQHVTGAVELLGLILAVDPDIPTLLA